MHRLRTSCDGSRQAVATPKPHRVGRASAARRAGVGGVRRVLGAARCRGNRWRDTQARGDGRVGVSRVQRPARGVRSTCSGDALAPRFRSGIEAPTHVIKGASRRRARSRFGGRKVVDSRYADEGGQRQRRRRALDRDRQTPARHRVVVIGNVGGGARETGARKPTPRRIAGQSGICCPSAGTARRDHVERAAQPAEDWKRGAHAAHFFRPQFQGREARDCRGASPCRLRVSYSAAGSDSPGGGGGGVFLKSATPSSAPSIEKTGKITTRRAASR